MPKELDDITGEKGSALSNALLFLDGAMAFFLGNYMLTRFFSEYMQTAIAKFDLSQLEIWATLGSISLLETITVKNIFGAFYKKSNGRYYSQVNNMRLNKKDSYKKDKNL